MKRKKITIDKIGKGDILIWTVGDLKHNILPDNNMLHGVEKMVTEAFKNKDGKWPLQIFVPPYIKVKRMKMDETVKYAKVQSTQDEGGIK
jgi:hypothetical protein